MVSLLPEDSLVRLRAVLGEKLGGLNARGVQTLVMADVEGIVTNQRLQQFSSDHTTDITKMLQDLVSKEFLVKKATADGPRTGWRNGWRSPEVIPRELVE